MEMGSKEDEAQGSYDLSDSGGCHTGSPPNFLMGFPFGGQKSEGGVH